MKIVLLELNSDLLWREGYNPKLVDTLTKLQLLEDSHYEKPILVVISNIYENESLLSSEVYMTKFFNKLKDLKISKFFEPFRERMIINPIKTVIPYSLFKTAINKQFENFPLHHAVFVSTNSENIMQARSLGITSLQIKGDGIQNADTEELENFLSGIERILLYSPCCKKLREAKNFSYSQVNKSKKIDPTIKKIIKNVNIDNLFSSIKRLTEFGSRWSNSPNINEVPKWVTKQFKTIGYSEEKEIDYLFFNLPGSSINPHSNIICKKIGKRKEQILICCHYDSISETPMSKAPGADDNASGVAATIEIARIIKDLPMEHSVIFAVFGGEEQGLFGSAACAEQAVLENWPIKLVINLDMISYQEPGIPSKIIIEYDQGNKVSNNDTKAKAFAMIMAQAAADYTDLKVAHTDIWNSDYIPFEEKGFSCIGVYNGTDNPFYHTVSDTIDRVDMNHFKEVVRMVLASIIQIDKEGINL
ncbi:Peptidase family M28 [Cnuella takakiae]|uniref:Peptidase family M28 n=1 Tax=Cnuella takakiae TaxID=1302690 RepID=A0A1M5CHF3_9BACT|nr:M28 family metallopeptidase [Cnuella takakiae]OLY91825.1 hypothetical protein BUE76_07870 [Cnuella takakiae]SHF54148.1 Peptidase family M28 [Cnuella takakiae]